MCSVYGLAFLSRCYVHGFSDRFRDIVPFTPNKPNRRRKLLVRANELASTPHEHAASRSSNCANDRQTPGEQSRQSCPMTNAVSAARSIRIWRLHAQKLKRRRRFDEVLGYLKTREAYASPSLANAAAGRLLDAKQQILIENAPAPFGRRVAEDCVTADIATKCDAEGSIRLGIKAARCSRYDPAHRQMRRRQGPQA